MPEALPTPEGQIRTYNPLQKSLIQPPLLVTAVAATLKKLYDKAVDGEMDKIVIHNLAATPVRYCINDDCTVNTFHDVMAGGNATDDGLGTVLTFYKQDGVFKITTFHETNAQRVSVTKFLMSGNV